jgi:hypothetical protein
MNGFNDEKIVNALKQAATLTSTTTGEIIDMQGFGFADILVQVGTSTTADGSNYFTVSLTHSDASNMAGEEAVTAALGLVGANLVINATTDADKVNHIGYAGNKRYIRLAATETGTASVQIAAVARLTKANFAPVSNADIAS